MFRNLLKLRWNELRTGVLSISELQGMVDQTADYLIKNEAIQRNYSIWDAGLGVNFESSVESLKSYLAARTQWMEGVISSF